MLKAVGGAVAFIAAIVGIVAGLNQLGIIPPFHPGGGPGFNPVTAPSFDPFASAEITLSRATAPRGASLTVNGSGFKPGELVEIRVHVTTVGTVTSDSSGRFVQTVTVPQSAPPAGFPTSVSATGHTSSKTASAPFSTA